MSKEKIDGVKVREEANRRILAQQKCFCCSQKAIAVANTCSPTSASGMTSPKPWCAYCLLSMRGGVNILEWRIPPDEAKKAIEGAIAFAKDRIEHFVNIASNRTVIVRGTRLLRRLE